MTKPLTTRQKLAKKIWKFCLRNQVNEHEIIDMLLELANNLKSTLRAKKLQEEVADLVNTITIFEDAFNDFPGKSMVDEYKTRLAQVQEELSQLPHAPNPL